MDGITQLFEIDWVQFVTNLLIIMAGAVALYKLGHEFFKVYGKPAKWVRLAQQDHAKIKETDEAMKEYNENRIKDREQSRQIQKELVDAQNQLAERQAELTEMVSKIVISADRRDEQIDALKFANKELLADKINSKYKAYISLGGIPEDEYDEFVSLHAAYKGLGGNHHGDSKFEYCMNHLPVLPVENQLIKRD